VGTLASENNAQGLGNLRDMRSTEAFDRARRTLSTDLSPKIVEGDGDQYVRADQGLKSAGSSAMNNAGYGMIRPAFQTEI
jgi:hypothetical protein